MQIGSVIGTARATAKHPSLEGWKLLVVQMLQVDGKTPDGDPLRTWSSSGADLAEDDGGLFRYLNASKRSVVGELELSEALIADADLLIEDLPPGAYDRQALRRRHPGLVILSITP